MNLAADPTDVSPFNKKKIRHQQKTNLLVEGDVFTTSRVPKPLKLHQGESPREAPGKGVHMLREIRSLLLGTWPPLKKCPVDVVKSQSAKKNLVIYEDGNFFYQRIDVLNTY